MIVRWEKLYYLESAGLHVFRLQAYLPNLASTKTPVGESLAWTRKVKRLPNITGLMLPHRALVTPLNQLTFWPTLFLPKPANTLNPDPLH